MSKELLHITPELQKNLAIVTDLKEQIDSSATLSMQIVVVDESTLSVAQQNLSKLTQLVSFIEEKRVIIKAPYLESGKFIDKTCKDLTDSLTKAVTHVKNQVKAWETAKLEEAKAKQAEIDRKLKEEADKLAAETKRKQDIQDYINNTSIPALKKAYEACVSPEICDDRLEAIEKGFKPREFFQEFADEAYSHKDNYVSLIKAKKEQLLAADTLSDSEKDLAKEKEAIALQKADLAAREAAIKASELAIKEANEAEAARVLAEQEKTIIEQQALLNKTKGIRFNWKFELVDINQVPKEWLMLDESKVKEFIKANKDSMKEGVNSGIKFYKDMSVVS